MEIRESSSKSNRRKVGLGRDLTFGGGRQLAANGLSWEGSAWASSAKEVWAQQATFADTAGRRLATLWITTIDARARAGAGACRSGLQLAVPSCRKLDQAIRHPEDTRRDHPCDQGTASGGRSADRPCSPVQNAERSGLAALSHGTNS